MDKNHLDYAEESDRQGRYYFSFDVNNLGWYSGTSRVYSDESPDGYSTSTTVDSVEYRVDTIESPLHHYKKQIINLNHLEMEY